MGSNNLVQNDQYYTKPDTVKRCLELLGSDMSKFEHIVEPSAGRGDFYNLLPPDKRIGLDIDPKAEGIIALDFFDFDIRKRGPVLTIGNPPFGKNASLAQRFFEKAATFSDIIAFILPRTFRKPSMVNRLNRQFHLVKNVLLDKESFYIDVGNGPEDYSVPCAFQVWAKNTKSLGHDTPSWARENIAREPIDELERHGDFSYVEAEEADFAIRRVGAHAGKVFIADVAGLSKASHYFIKSNALGVAMIFARAWENKWSPSADPDETGTKYDTAGNPSLSKPELVHAYVEYKEKSEQ